jgi:hypothetical protein
MPTTITNYVWDHIKSVPLSVAVLEEFDLKTKDDAKRSFGQAVRNIKKRTLYNKRVMEPLLSKFKIDLEKVCDKSINYATYTNNCIAFFSS